MKIFTMHLLSNQVQSKPRFHIFCTNVISLYIDFYGEKAHDFFTLFLIMIKSPLFLNIDLVLTSYPRDYLKQFSCSFYP